MPQRRRWFSMPWVAPLFFLGYGGLVLALCAKASPLFAVQDWVDAHAFFTMGKGMMQGLVPYRDLFDHKGPLLYLIYGLASLVQPDGFGGVFGLQVLSLAATLWFAYRTMERMTGSRHAALVLALLVPVLLLSNGIYVKDGADSGGGSVEEFFVPLMAWALWLVVDCLPGEGRLADGRFRRVMLQCGLLCGCTLLLKFTQAVFFLGLGLPVLWMMARQRRWKALLSGLGLFVGGLALALLPYLCYALATDSLSSFGEAYLAFNLLYGAGGPGGALGSLLRGLTAIPESWAAMPLLGVFTLAGILYLLFGCRQLAPAARAGMVLGYGLLAVASYGAGQLSYTTIPLAYFALFGYCGVYALACAQRPRRVPPRAASLGVLAFQGLVLLALTVGANGLLVRSSASPLFAKESPPPVQRVMGDILRREGGEGRTLLCPLAMDYGFYTYGDTLPGSRYFYTPNILYSQYPWVLNSQLEALEAAENEFVLLNWKPSFQEDAAQQPLGYGTILPKMDDAVRAGYVWVATAPGGAGIQGDRDFYLYQRKDRFMAEEQASFTFTPSNHLLEAGGNATRQGDALLAQGEGLAVTGPHVPLGAGGYEATFAFSQVEALDFGSIYVDVTDYGMPLSEEVVEEAGEVTVSFELYEDTQDVELRVYLADDSRLRLDSITLRLVEAWQNE